MCIRDSSHGCPGCHNPDSQPCAGGTVRAIADVVAEIAANKLVQGVTISGGEPFEQAAACAELARQVRELGLDVWTYSGYRYEQLAEEMCIRDRFRGPRVLRAEAGWAAKWLP